MARCSKSPDRIPAYPSHIRQSNALKKVERSLAANAFKSNYLEAGEGQPGLPVGGAVLVARTDANSRFAISRPYCNTAFLHRSSKDSTPPGVILALNTTTSGHLIWRKG